MRRERKISKQRLLRSRMVRRKRLSSANKLMLKPQIYSVLKKSVSHFRRRIKIVHSQAIIKVLKMSIKMAFVKVIINSVTKEMANVTTDKASVTTEIAKVTKEMVKPEQKTCQMRKASLERRNLCFLRPQSPKIKL